MGLLMSEKDEIVMSLVHYLITEENYTPIIVKGAKDEIWLENMEGPYKVVRINSNHIHNEEQFDYDILKTKSVLRQIKRRTFSMSVNILNIFLDINKKPEKDYKHMDIVVLDSLKSVPENSILTSAFRKIKTGLKTEGIDLEEIIHKTEDVNRKTEKKNKVYEDIFKEKPIIITKILMLACVIYFLVIFFKTHNEFSASNLVYYGANYRDLVKSGEWYRLFSCMFLHANFLHLIINMYALKLIGYQLETYLGKVKFLIVFIISGLVGSLFSAIFTNAVSVGASGAIFGLLGSLMYFAYHYRLVLGNTLKNDIIPVLIINLLIGFTIPGIDISAHLGGLIGGVFTTMALGVPGKESKRSMINGTVCLLMLVGFLSYILFYYI
ncbi:MAG: rhomboid family intramembrane serine protease [Bacilli bacterium]|nr:rhomboid family intramembrane serine protease [Bacilli bacterium]